MKFGTVPPEPARQTSLEDLEPGFAAAVARVLATLTGDGWDPVVYEAVRSDARQAWLYGFGRTYDDGRGIVTHAATADQGWHRFALAVDIISAAHGWDSAAFFDALQAAAHGEALTSGSDWQMRDRPHVQHGGMRATPSPATAALAAASGLAAVWADVVA